MPPTSKLFLSGCRHRPSEKTAIHVRYVHPFSVATLKWGLEGATNVRSLSGVMAVFFEEPGMAQAWRRATLRSEAISGFLEAADATSPKGKSWETLRKG